MDIKKIKILLLEDNPDDARLISMVLNNQAFEFELTIVESKEKYILEVTNSQPDIILSDHRLPLFTSSEALVILKNSGLKIPFILVTGAVSEEFAVMIMKSGADDYILKDRLQRLPCAILKALQKFSSDRLQQETELKIKASEKKYSSLVEHLPTNIALLNREGIILDVNNSWKLFADENNFSGVNYGIGTNYIDVANNKVNTNANEGMLIADAIRKIIKAELNDYSVIYSCHSPVKSKWFKAIVSRENNEKDSGIVVMHVDVTEQKEAELRVKQSEANLSAIFNHTDIAFVLLDSSLNIVSSNKVANVLAYQAFGVNTIERLNLISLISEDKKKLAKKVLISALTGKSTDKDGQYKMTDGSIKWFRVKMNNVKDDAGEIIGLCLSVADITNQVSARKKIEESEKRFQSLIENSTDMKTLATPEGKITYASPSVTKELGYSIDEFLNTPVHNLISKEDAPAVNGKIQGLIGFPGKSLYSQHRLVHKNGQLIWCEGTITNMLHEPSISALVSNFKNITERKNLEVLYQMANKLARLGSWDLNLLSKQLYWSDITKEIHEVDLNFKPELETAINFYKEGLSRDTISSVITEAVSSGKSWDVELQIVTAKKTEKWVRAIGEVETNNGVCIRIFGSFQDIDAGKKAEIERTRIANDLLKHNENLEQFAYIVSHNLRAPVANILGLTNIFKGNLTEADRNRAQTYLVDAASQMDSTIKDLNKILQIRSEYSEFKESIYLPDLLNDVRSSIQNMVNKENVKIDTNFNEINTIISIKSYVQSVFYNLLLNSIKYRKKGVAPVIEIKSKLFKEKYKLIFKDNGTGIDLNKHGGKIFGLYNRFHMDVEGKGLGLFMIKTQIEVLGGSITVKSEPDAGAEFIIELPL